MSQEINLYEERLRPRREVLTARNLAVAALALLLGVMGAAAWTEREAAEREAEAEEMKARAEDRQTRLTALAKAVSERSVSPALAARLSEARETLADRANVIEQLESGRLGSATGFSGFFSGFARQAPVNPDLWLTGFIVDRGGGAVEIHGRTLDASMLPVYVQRLGSESAFAGRRFAGLEMSRKDLAEDAAGKPRPAPAAAGKATGAAAAPGPARFVEFVLRSEGAADGLKDATLPGGRTP
ncbi:MAG: hypothetical protein LBI87_01565 [Candidatus Accumulibacter sp.]|jgi:hypothetical protein|nr:hypothetical protein [Accumulibacter sp.]